MKSKYNKAVGLGNKKVSKNQSIQLELPAIELAANLSEKIEAFSTELGLEVIKMFMNAEIEQRVGKHGKQSHYRHGSQSGYVIYAGRKIAIQRPRMRAKADGKEAQLESYKTFQQDGKMQRAVSSKMIRQVSTRNYKGALDACMEGYGIDKSSVSRHWKAATVAELEKLCNGPIPEDIVCLMIDGKHLKQECVVVALRVDTKGVKHVLGLWHGASENTTVVKALLEDLVERGLNPNNESLLVVIDGAKALAKAVKTLFGQRALIQRCRVHKKRNVLEHLPQDKQHQGSWRLNAAWAQSDPNKARKELKKVVRWLDSISPGAARSLEEGLEETLTVNRLGLNESLTRSLSSTNLIESCFSRTQESIHRVKYWRNPQMFLRWMAAALLFAQKGFRKIKGHRHMDQLVNALKNYSLDPSLIAA